MDGKCNDVTECQKLSKINSTILIMEVVDSIVIKEVFVTDIFDSVKLLRIARESYVIIDTMDDSELLFYSEDMPAQLAEISFYLGVKSHVSLQCSLLVCSEV